MEFKWDERKNRWNKDKHGIDFETAMKLWNDKNRIEIQTLFSIENRSILIRKIEKKLWSAIFSLRGDAIRIISVRRARKKEAKFYEQKKLAKNTEEFDRRFDDGEDIHDLIDMRNAKTIRHGKRVRITLDIAEALVKDID